MHKSKLHRNKKFRILLDAAFAKPDSFPLLKKKANVAHMIYDCGLPPQASDEEIYQKAVEEERFVLTINFKDFRKLVRKGKSGIFGIESQLTNQEIDKKVARFLVNKVPNDFIGKAIKIT